MNALCIKNLYKSYGNAPCLEDCNLEVSSGQIFGLLGPNGAGKSTLLRTLMGFLNITSGSAQVCGFDVQSESLKVRQNTSYLPGDARLPRASTGLAALRLFSGLHPASSLEGSLAVAKRLQLDLRRRVMFMSTGMRQKLALSVVLGCRAPLVILDEPTANLDPDVRATVLELVREVKQDGRTVLLSSHIFSDIDETCDEVAILREGRILAQQSLSHLEQRYLVMARTRNSFIPSGLNNEHFQLEQVEKGRDGNGEFLVDMIELQLVGEPKTWLAWLADQPLEVQRIEKTGVRNLYQKANRNAEGVVWAEGDAR